MPVKLRLNTPRRGGQLRFTILPHPVPLPRGAYEQSVQTYAAHRER